MHPGRILGVVMGLVILVTFFAVPFYSTNGQSTTLYNNMTSVYNSLGSTQGSGNAGMIAAAYVLLIGAILILIAGFVGVFPLGTGVLGIVGMAMITLSPYLTTPGAAGNGFDIYEVGYYLIWAASVIALGASFWHGKRKPEVLVQNIIAPSQSQPPPPPQQLLRRP